MPITKGNQMPDEAKKNINEKVLFGVGPSSDGLGPVMIVGIPKDAWDYMSDGKTHQMDLTKIGLPIRLMLFGCKDHAEGMKFLEGQARDAGAPYRDQRRTDVSFDANTKVKT